MEENNIKRLSSAISNFVQLLKESLLVVHKENTLLGGKGKDFNLSWQNCSGFLF